MSAYGENPIQNMARGCRVGGVTGKTPWVADGAIGADGLVALKNGMTAAGQEKKITRPLVKHLNHRDRLQAPIDRVV